MDIWMGLEPAARFYVS